MGASKEAIQGCFGVFHVATPMDFDSKDPENEVIKPTINGVLSIIRSCAKAKTVKRLVFTNGVPSIIRSCAKAKTVKRLVFTSSAGTVTNLQGDKTLFDESDWFKGIGEKLEIVSFSTKKLIEIGFKYKYSLDDMFKGAIETCREKGLIRKIHPITPTLNKLKKYLINQKRARPPNLQTLRMWPTRIVKPEYASKRKFHPATEKLQSFLSFLPEDIIG